jgi:hypothetical protein
MGGILSQVGDDGIERPIAYASRSLSDKEKGAAAYATEAAGLVWCFRTFRPYLIGAPFRARVDHKPLLQLNRVQGQTVSRLYAELEEFLPYTLEYLPGNKMPADGLSRQGSTKQIAATNAAVTQGLPPPLGISWAQLYHLQRQDSQSKTLACYAKFGLVPKDHELAALVKKLPDWIWPQGCHGSAWSLTSQQINWK